MKKKAKVKLTPAKKLKSVIAIPVTPNSKSPMFLPKNAEPFPEEVELLSDNGDASLAGPGDRAPKNKLSPMYLAGNQLATMPADPEEGEDLNT